MPLYPFRNTDTGETHWEYFPMAEMPAIGTERLFPEHGQTVFERIFQVGTTTPMCRATIHTVTRQLNPHDAREVAEKAGVSISAHGEPQLDGRRDMQKFRDTWNAMEPGGQRLQWDP